jgi:hypothetical protein
VTPRIVLRDGNIRVYGLPEGYELVDKRTPTWTPTFAGQPQPGTMYWGAAVGGNSPVPVDYETTGPLPVRRTFYQWKHVDTGYLAATATSDLAAGRLPWVSVKTPPWVEVAAGAHDATIDSLANQLAAAAGPVWLTVWHEPENDAGSPADHVAMNTRVRGRLPGNVALGLILMGWTWDTRSGRNPDDWYAPDVYDIIATDPYTEQNNPYHVAAPEAWDAMLSWLVGKPEALAVGEWGMRGTDVAAYGNVGDWYDTCLGAGAAAACAFDSGLNAPSGSWTLAGGQRDAFVDLLEEPSTARVT